MTKYLVLLLALGLWACERKPEPVKIAESQRAALEKAKAVEQTLQQGADETRRKSDEAEPQ